MTNLASSAEIARASHGVCCTQFVHEIITFQVLLRVRILRQKSVLLDRFLNRLAHLAVVKLRRDEAFITWYRELPRQACHAICQKKTGDQAALLVSVLTVGDHSGAVGNPMVRLANPLSRNTHYGTPI